MPVLSPWLPPVASGSPLGGVLMAGAVRHVPPAAQFRRALSPPAAGSLAFAVVAGAILICPGLSQGNFLLAGVSGEPLLLLPRGRRPVVRRRIKRES